jgi:hypothetical protein
VTLGLSEIVLETSVSKVEGSEVKGEVIKRPVMMSVRDRRLMKVSANRRCATALDPSLESLLYKENRKSLDYYSLGLFKCQTSFPSMLEIVVFTYALYGEI